MSASKDDARDETRRQREFATMLRSLARPQAFPFALSDGGSIAVLHTHASAVLLAGNRAYKLKKPNDFGFFNYSTPALRRHFCAEEVRLNARLAPDVYRGVAPVVAMPDGSHRFAETQSPDALPAPDAPLAEGRVVDYAVVMVRLPDEATLAARVRADTARPEMLSAIAERVAAFHAASRTSEEIARFGALDVIQHNWDENFEQMAPYVGRALDAATFDRIQTYVRSFLRHRLPLLEMRVRTGRIRDCHGDLRMQHIYFLDRTAEGEHAENSGNGSATDYLAVIDCIEFNERFRYGDVASELAFLAMELDGADRPDLARSLVDAYVAASGDESLRELLPFYACYRACVRGKVTAFQLDEPEVPVDQRAEARREAQMLFALAGRYASAPSAPVLLLVGGLMGAGKTTLARRLDSELGWATLSSDTVRKELAGLDPAQPQERAYDEGIYSHEWNARTYRALLARAASMLAEGRSVIVDASFARRTDRLAALEVARTADATAIFAECVCPRVVALARLGDRWRRRHHAAGPRQAASARQLRTDAAAADASDGRPAIYDAQAAAWEPVDDEERAAGLTHLPVDTGGSAPASVSRVLDELGIVQPVNWL